MSSRVPADGVNPVLPEPDVEAEAPRTRMQNFWLLVEVVELRLRFIVLMAATGLIFAYWDNIWNRYDKWMRPKGQSQVASIGIEYYCPMHPQVVQDQPGTCPICGMPLAKRPKGKKTPLPEGVTARVELSPFRVAQAGIETVDVSYAPLVQTITTVGYVAFDERGLANIVSKVPGKSRVEKLFVNYSGQDVKVGETLAELYSPELAQAIQELLNASRRAESATRPQTEIGRSLISDRQELVRATAEKLKRWGISQAQIDQILKKGKSDLTIAIHSPLEGHIFKKNVVEGQEVPEGFVMFEAADLKTVWVQAQVFENQLGLVHEGQSVEATVDAYPGKTFPGKVEFIQPHLDPATRTVEVRYALDNRSHVLRPGMFATVKLQTPVSEMVGFSTRTTGGSNSMADGHPVALTPAQQKICPVTNAKLGSMGEPILVEVEGRKIWTCCDGCAPKLLAEPAKYLARLAAPPRNEVLSVPETAVIDTGTRKVVYVEKEPGTFEGREVVLGQRIGNRYPVISGLSVGEKVAAAGAFLIDAESRINPGLAPAAASSPNAPKLDDTPAPTATHGNHVSKSSVMEHKAKP